MEDFIQVKRTDIIGDIRREIHSWMGRGYPRPHYIILGPYEALMFNYAAISQLRYFESKPATWDGTEFEGTQIITGDRSGLWVGWKDPHIATRLEYDRQRWANEK